MTNYRRGDVILVNIPFSGVAGFKKRPAVVLSMAVFNSTGTKLIVAAITSNLAPPLRPGDTENPVCSNPPPCAACWQRWINTTCFAFWAP